MCILYIVIQFVCQESCSSGSNAPIKTRVFGQPSRKKPLSRLSLVTQDTMRRRLDFAVDEDCMAVNRLPFVVMDVFQEDEEIEIDLKALTNSKKKQ